MGGPPSPWQFALVGYIPLFTANISAIGSGLIIYSIAFTNGRKKLKEPHHRLLMALSMYDFIYSIQKAFTFLLAPKGMQLPGAQGNLATCTLQGMIIQLVHATPLYNATLSMYYWLTICRGMKTETFVKYEPYIHGIIFVLMSSLAITGAVIGLYNPAFSFCFIGSWPPGCETGPGSPQCERWPPQMMGLMYEIFANVWAQICFVVVLVTNVDIWWKVRQQERTIRKYTKEFEKKQQNNFMNKITNNNSMAPVESETIQRKKDKFNRERSVAIQSTLYVSAFILCWIGPLSFHLVDWIAGYKAFWCVLVLVIFTPTQGIWNAFTYARPTYNRIMRKRPDLSTYQAFQLIFFYPEDLPTIFTSRDGGASTSGRWGISTASKNSATRTSHSQFNKKVSFGDGVSYNISNNSNSAIFSSQVPQNDIPTAGTNNNHAKFLSSLKRRVEELEAELKEKDNFIDDYIDQQNETYSKELRKQKKLNDEKIQSQQIQLRQQYDGRESYDDEIQSFCTHASF